MTENMSCKLEGLRASQCERGGLRRRGEGPARVSSLELWCVGRFLFSVNELMGVIGVILCIWCRRSWHIYYYGVVTDNKTLVTEYVPCVFPLYFSQFE